MTSTCCIDRPTLADWQRKIGLDKHSLTRDPRYRDAEAQDFRLRKDSPCIDRGRPLSVAVGAGDNADVLTIRNDGYYTKHVRKDPTKHGGAPPTQQPLRMPFLVGDLIQIGKGANTRRTTVVEILDNKRLMLDRKVSWKDGDWVTFPFKGDAPDIGAYEFGDERVIIGPTWKHYPKREFKVVRQE